MIVASAAASLTAMVSGSVACPMSAHSGAAPGEDAAPAAGGLEAPGMAAST